MVSQEIINQAAQQLTDQYLSDQPFMLSDGLIPNTLDEAYEIQKAFQSNLIGKQGPVVGYKLAYTTSALQQNNGVTEPCMGLMLEKNIRYSPSELSSTDFVQLGIECEVGVSLKHDLSYDEAPYDVNKVSEAVESIMPAFEVIDNRRTPGLPADINLKIAVASNISNAGVILGEPVSNWKEIDLISAYGYMSINNRLVGDGHGYDVMGHPLNPLAWLANKLSSQGISLPAKSLIITGSIVSPKFLKTGDSAFISIEGLGTAELNVT